MNENSPIERLKDISPGGPIGAKWLNRTTRALVRMNAGVAPPQHIINKPTSTGGGATLDNVTLYAHAASTANLTLSGAQTVDGIALVAGNYCLAKNQTTTANRDLYLVATGAWIRQGTSDEPIPSVHVLNGTTNGKKLYSLSGTTYSAATVAVVYQ